MRYAQTLTNPIVAATLAAVIVLALAALGASHLTMRNDGGAMTNIAVEKVMLRPPRAVMHQSAAVSLGGSPVKSTSAGLAPLIARTAKVSLYVDNVDKAAEALARIARAGQGDVFSSDIEHGDGSVTQPNGQMQLRVVAERFDSVLSAIAQHGKVREQSTSAEDLTGDITDTDARLRNLRRTESDILKIMDRSGDVSQVMDVENQLSQVREQIETLESQLKEMRGRVAYATIDVTMEAEAASTPVQPTAKSQLAVAWQSAVASLAQLTIGLAAIALWLFVFSPYMLVAIALGWLVYTRMRKAHAGA